MRVFAVVAAAAFCGSCFQSRTVDCGDGFVCPPEQACAAPGYCGDPVAVEKCEGKATWDACAFTDVAAGSCRFGICEACTPDRAGCGSGWRAMSSPTTADLNDVLVIDRANAYAVGNGGTLLQYDGTRWSPVVTTPPIPGDLDLQSVWGANDDELFVVSSDAGERNVLRVNGRTLSYEMMASYGIKAVWGTAPDNVYAVGLGGTIRRFDGMSWQQASTGMLPLGKLHGASASRAFAVGPSGAFARLDGATWSHGRIMAGAAVTNVWVGEREAFIVGAARTLLRLVGDAWEPVTFDATVPVGLDLFAVWGTGERFYAVGDAGKIVASQDAATWTDASPNLGSTALRAIDGTSAAIFVVGAAGAIWLYSE